MGNGRAIDVVYTWVDDSFPGYGDQLQQYAKYKHDSNPNRTRDNLEVLKYSLRSLARYFPNMGKVFLLTCRPQVPDWLNTGNPHIQIVHHDEIIAPEHLPTFNSFAIISHLHLIPDLSKKFLYVEDDMLFNSSRLIDEMTDSDGRPYVFCRNAKTIQMSSLDEARSSPWNLALATADLALDREFTPRQRHHIIHGPQLVDRDIFAEMIERFPSEIETTRRSRFRANGNVPPEYLYQQYLIDSGKGVLAGSGLSRHVEGYASLENFLPWTWLQLRRLEFRKPLTITLNDSFEKNPNPGVEQHVRQTLEKWMPDPSSFEKAWRDQNPDTTF